MRVGGLFHRTNAHITFGRNKNFLIGPNGSGKTTIVHILASCLRNDFTQLFELPFRTAEITLTGTVSPKETKVAIAQRYNTESGRRTLNVSITGDYQHSEDIELRATQQLPAWTGDLKTMIINALLRQPQASRRSSVYLLTLHGCLCIAAKSVNQVLWDRI
jgi:predicted ATP-binding protein involved in virulence